MTHWRREGQILLLAVGFLTRLPVPPDPDFDDDKLSEASRYFPLVGLLVGALAVLVLLISHSLFSSLPLAVLLSMLASLLVTGAFHEDGLADSADGFGGGYRREDVLRIMKDSRIGTYGAVALFGVLALKAASLSAMASPWVVASALLWGHGVSRWLAISLLLDLPYVRGEGKSKPLAREISRRYFWLAGAPLLGLLLLGHWPALLILALVLLVLRYAVGVWLRRRLGGYSGDVLGAVQQVTEVLIYLCFLL